ncbi:unnamed protein product [Rotaria sordida]|uniref:Uncharacterized protein n=2 Tax=Rotaria sordida TaxID=392033 RepID=A0A819JSM2_9BILA|nr:unnamed protein product [Rotaria sordida]CAF1380312.1 unnamed protein product [Rotaria sordida]CAF1594005.1 unnamed protein product [Rotaria sordida]CAF1594028.1 unnamed protein product [Rotaria sordida]CAF3911756.1 unnamed protein product [Rotaria sordida]
MTLQQSTYSHPIINAFAREKFYELAKKHIDTLNLKFCNKAVITCVQSQWLIVNSIYQHVFEAHGGTDKAYYSALICINTNG